MGGGRHQVRGAAGRGRHVEPRPGRGLLAGRARAAGGQPQGRGAPAAARRPLGPLAGAALV